MTMIQRRFYLPKKTYRRLQLLAKSTKQNISQALRELVEEGLKCTYRKRRRNASALLNLAQIAETEGWNGPKDLATNHDKYFIH